MLKTEYYIWRMGIGRMGYSDYFIGITLNAIAEYELDTLSPECAF